MRQKLCSIIAMFSLLALVGCERLVSSDRHLDNSIRANGDDVDYVAPQHRERLPEQRDPIELPRLRSEEDLDIDGDVERPPHMQSGNMNYLSFLYSTVVEMRDEVMRLTARAEQKGAGGRAALDPKLRTFHTSVRLINRYVVQFYDADAAEWEALKVKINEEIKAARSALREAAEAIERVKDEGHLITA